jgi:hypothetical protein
MFVVELPLADAAMPGGLDSLAVNDQADAGGPSEKSCAEAIEAVNY